VSVRTVSRAAACAAAFLAALTPAAADHIPVPPQGVVEYSGRTAALISLGSMELIGELQGGLEDTDHRFGYRAVTVGGYFRLLPNLKVGAFYRLQAGARHDDDWVANPNRPPGWVWQDTTGRLEHLLMLDVSPRFALDFMPGRNWVLMLKGRYIVDSYELQQSVLVRPELTYFWMIDRDPFLSLSLSYDLYFPLNFGQTVIYQQYPYLNVIYHMTPNVMLELGGAYKSTVWSAGAPVRASGESLAGYPVTFNAWVVAAGVIFRFTP
jgi:hypothetical protein